jgi:hypothetical protein
MRGRTVVCRESVPWGDKAALSILVSMGAGGHAVFGLSAQSATLRSVADLRSTVSSSD